jgi:uncharacterized membrane protein
MQAQENPVITRLVIGPNASLSGAGAWGFLGLMAVVALGIAAVFAARGYWPILPFAGLELVALGAALWVTQRRNRYREVLSFTESVIRIEFGVVGQGAYATAELPRAWTKVSVSTGPYRTSPTRLGLDYCGQRITIGRCLTDEERERLAMRIRELLRPGWRTSATPEKELSLGES